MPTETYDLLYQHESVTYNEFAYSFMSIVSPDKVMERSSPFIHIHIHIHLFAFISVIGTEPSRYRTCQSNMLHAFHTQ
jgi:hypothetical protein